MLNAVGKVLIFLISVQYFLHGKKKFFFAECRILVLHKHALKAMFVKHTKNSIMPQKKAPVFMHTYFLLF